MDNIQSFLSHVQSISHNESLNALIESQIANKKKTDFTPKNYFYITHVTNPAQAYWSIKRTDVKKSSLLARKLLVGKKYERLASSWFKSLPSFVLEEGKLDGIWVDIPGVRGSVDFRFGDSILEFKTKDKLPENYQDIISEYPQDLEQLLFYAAIHPKSPLFNHLIFMHTTKPNKILAFKVQINDMQRIKDILKSRIEILKDALARDSHERLGKCRYEGKFCQYEENKICQCATQSSINMDAIKSSISVEIDEKFSEELNACREKSGVDEGMFTTKDVIAPRKYFMENVLDMDTSWVPNIIKDEYDACLSNLIRYSQIFFPAHKNTYNISNVKEKRLQIGYRWMWLKSSTKDYGEAIPYLTKVNLSHYQYQTSQPGDYSIAELAIICAAYKKSRGMIFVVYPNLQDQIRTFEITFKDVDDLLKKVGMTLDKLSEACEKKDILMVPECPNFMNNKETCEMLKECHSVSGMGCIKK